MHQADSRIWVLNFAAQCGILPRKTGEFKSLLQRFLVDYDVILGEEGFEFCHLVVDLDIIIIIGQTHLQNIAIRLPNLLRDELLLELAIVLSPFQNEFGIHRVFPVGFLLVLFGFLVPVLFEFAALVDGLNDLVELVHDLWSNVPKALKRHNLVFPFLDHELVYFGVVAHNIILSQVFS